jgi:hypothetical protein
MVLVQVQVQPVQLLRHVLHAPPLKRQMDVPQISHSQNPVKLFSSKMPLQKANIGIGILITMV